MKLPLCREELARVEPTDCEMQERPLRQIHLGLLDRLVFQARLAIELSEALEWLKETKWSVWEKDGEWYCGDIPMKGSTPLEAIEAAMRAEK